MQPFAHQMPLSAHSHTHTLTHVLSYCQALENQEKICWTWPLVLSQAQGLRFVLCGMPFGHCKAPRPACILCCVPLAMPMMTHMHTCTHHNVCGSPSANTTLVDVMCQAHNTNTTYALETCSSCCRPELCNAVLWIALPATPKQKLLCLLLRLVVVLALCLLFGCCATFCEGLFGLVVWPWATCLQMCDMW